LNKKDNSKALAHELPAISATDPKTIHGQFRNCRITAQGTYLLPFLQKGLVVEYDKTWKEIWTVASPTPWSAVRLKNGDTLIPGDNRGFVHEVNPKGEIVWAIESNTLPGIVLHDVQTASRLDNGDTLICNRGGGSKTVAPAQAVAGGAAVAQVPAPAQAAAVQVVEVTPDKKVVWVLQDSKDLPSCSGIQLLDEPGTPETPGDLQR
jgi:hypothetical protein